MTTHAASGYLPNTTIAQDFITVPVVFTPRSIGSRSAVLVVEGNMDAGPLSIPLTGTGTYADAPVEHIPDHDDLAEARVMYQFRNAVKFKAHMKAIGTRIQPLEDAAFKMLAFFDIDAMEGVVLDVMGKIVGQPRTGGELDAPYRASLRARMAVNSSQGTLLDLVTICRIFLGDDGDLLVAEVYPAEIEILTELPTNGFDEWGTLHDALEAAAPGGVSVGAIRPIEIGTFGWAEDDTALGFNAGNWSNRLY